MHDDPTTAGTTAQPTQRWRLVLARSADAPALTQREVAERWEAAIVGAGLPLARSDGAASRPRISFGAPLPVGMAAHGELIDLVLTERWPVWRVREALTPWIPDGWRLVELQDVWLAGPPLAGRVAAADYRIVLDVTADGGVAPIDASSLRSACAAFLGAARIERERAKGDGIVTYDLRPLVIDVRVDDPPTPLVLIARTRFHPELGTGRPEEVVGALATFLGQPIGIASIVRERLILADQLAANGGRSAASD